MAFVLYVKIKSDVDYEELMKRVADRRPSFLEVPGLIQKIYGRDPETGDICGIYFFKDNESLDAFKTSELAKTIPSAYDAADVRREVYEVLFSLYSDRGPI